VADSIDIRLLRALPVLLRERSVSRAAEALRLSQPATSHLLARLRRLLNDDLLLRSRHGMVPTERALELEKGVLALLDHYELLVQPVEVFRPAEAQRTFNLSSPESAERVLIPPLLRRLRREAPNVRIIVHAPKPERMLELLERGDLDLRIAWLVSAPETSLRSVRLLDDRLVCVTDKANSSVGAQLTLEKYLSAPQIRTFGYSQTVTGRAIDKAVMEQGRELPPPQVVHNFVTMMQSLIGTDLIATVPRMLADESNIEHRLRIMEAPLPFPSVRYAAYWHERRHADAGHCWLRNLLVEVGRDLEARYASEVPSVEARSMVPTTSKKATRAAATARAAAAPSQDGRRGNRRS